MANPARAQISDVQNLAPAQSRIIQFVANNQLAVQAFLNSGSDLLDGYLSAQFDLPLKAPYPQDVIDFEVMFAAYRILVRLGMDPRSPTDQLIVEEWKAKIAWAEMIAREQITPNIIDSSNDSALGGPFVVSSTSRGYSERGMGAVKPLNINADPFSGD